MCCAGVRQPHPALCFSQVLDEELNSTIRSAAAGGPGRSHGALAGHDLGYIPNNNDRQITITSPCRFMMRSNKGIFIRDGLPRQTSAMAMRWYVSILPALYYVLAVGRSLTGNWYAGTLFALTLVSALGSLGAYFWARSFVPPPIAVRARVFYAFMPYHLAEVYQASQLAEFAAGAALLGRP